MNVVFVRREEKQRERSQATVKTRRAITAETKGGRT